LLDYDFGVGHLGLVIDVESMLGVCCMSGCMYGDGMVSPKIQIAFENIINEGMCLKVSSVLILDLRHGSNWKTASRIAFA
jgi:hypothetical protein